LLKGPNAYSEILPPALLSRARTIAQEHKELSQKLSGGFDATSAKKLGELSSVTNALNEFEKAKEVRELKG